MSENVTSEITPPVLSGESTGATTTLPVPTDFTPTPASTGTNLGPLTTAYKFPSSCRYVFSETSLPYNYYWAQSCTNGGIIDDPTCWPSTASNVESTTGALNGWGYYSPGLVCPSGWLTACSATATADAQISGDFSFQFSLSAQETALGCCPSGYICTFDLVTHQSCVQSVTTTSTFTAAACVFTANSIATFIATAIPSQIWAPMIELVYKSTDLSLNVTATGTATTSAPTITTPITSSGLSPAADAGIGVGIAAVILSILGFLWFWRRKRRAKALVGGGAQELDLQGGRAELPNGDKGEMHEAPAEERPSELPAGYENGPMNHHMPSELPANER
ncbi:hypothetical protein BX600DRAFT_506262 [Xylariales sp. PMI_506]|nr:hypothetical protein BX600DRAFT_506262 [Xylariales sp. PMI_506]